MMDKGTEEECNLIHLSKFCRRNLFTRVADHAHRSINEFTPSKMPVGRTAKLLFVMVLKTNGVRHMRTGTRIRVRRVELGGVHF